MIATSTRRQSEIAKLRRRVAKRTIACASWVSTSTRMIVATSIAGHVPGARALAYASDTILAYRSSSGCCSRKGALAQHLLNVGRDGDGLLPNG